MCAVGSWLRGRLVLLWAGTTAPKLRGTAIAKADARSEDWDFRLSAGRDASAAGYLFNNSVDRDATFVNAIQLRRGRGRVVRW